MTAQSTNPAGTIVVSATTFKDQALELMRRIAKSGQEVVVTVRGEPIAKLVPFVRRTGNRFVGSGQQTVRIAGGGAGLAALMGGGAQDAGAPPKALPAVSLPPANPAITDDIADTSLDYVIEEEGTPGYPSNGATAHGDA